MHQNRRLFTVLALAMMAGALALVAAEALPQVGQMAPGFTLPSQDGTNVSLKDFKGKWVVLYFYPKDDTPACTTQACNLRDNYSLLLQKGFSIIGISTDTVKKHKKFESKYSLPFPLIADEDHSIAEKYGVWGWK